MGLRFSLGSGARKGRHSYSDSGAAAIVPSAEAAPRLADGTPGAESSVRTIDSEWGGAPRRREVVLSEAVFGFDICRTIPHN
jgi:hypothetical protein